MNGIADFFNFTKDVGQNFYQNVLADPSTYSFQKNPDEFNLRDVTDIIFDPDDPIDKASLALLAFPPAFGAARIGQTLRKGGKLTSALKSGIADPKLSQRAGAFIGYPFLADEASAMTRGIGLRGDEYSGILSKDTLDTISQLGEEYMDDPELVNAILAAELTGKDFTEYLSDNKKEMLGLKNGGIASFKTGTGTKGVIKSLGDIVDKIRKTKKDKTKKTDPKPKVEPKTPEFKMPTKEEIKGLDVKVDLKKNKIFSKDGKSFPINSTQGRTILENAKLRRQQALKGPIERGIESGISGVGNIASRGGKFIGPRIAANPVTSGLLGGAGAAAIIASLLSGDDEDKDDDDPPPPPPIPEPEPEVTQPQLNAFQRYQKLLSENPDFARAQLAGFMNMMKPQAGIVPISAPVAFVEGMLGEEDRQRKGTPAEIKTLQFLQANPDLAEFSKSLGGSKAGSADALKLAGSGEFAVLVKKALGFETGDAGDFDVLVSGQQDPMLFLNLAILAQNDPSALAKELRREDAQGNPIYSLKKKDD